MSKTVTTMSDYMVKSSLGLDAKTVLKISSKDLTTISKDAPKYASIFCNGL